MKLLEELDAKMTPSWKITFSTTFILLSIGVFQTMADPLLLYLDRLNIRSYDLGTNVNKVLATAVFQNAIAMDYHHVNKKLYVSDVIRKKLYVVDLTTSPPDVTILLSTGLSVPDGLAVDWVNNNLYWTDTGVDQINVMDLDTKKTATILDRDLFEPRGIKLDVRDNQKWMYFTDWGFKHGIFRARLDGSDRQTLVNTDMIWPNGMSIDFSSNKLYWVDGRMSRLEMSNLDGTSRVKVLESLNHPFSVVAHGSDIYWTEWEPTSVKKINTNSPQTIHTVTSQVSNKPTAILVNVGDLQPAGTAVCGSNNGGCSDVCLPSLVNGFSCACPNGTALTTNSKTCFPVAPTSAPSTDLKLVWAENDDNNLTRLGVLLGDPHIWVDTLKVDVKHITPSNILERYYSKYASVDFRSYSSEIFFSDHGWKKVDRLVYNPNTQDNKFVRVCNTSSQINGLAVDWLSDSVYMTDTLNGMIVVCNGHRTEVCKNLITGLNQPFGIAVHPLQGWMVWTSYGNPPRIEKSRLDGTNRQVLVSDAVKPMGIAIDYKRNHLYYVEQPINSVRKLDFNGQPAGNPYTINIATDVVSPLLYDITMYDDILFVTDLANRKIWVINTSTYKTIKINLSNLPGGVAMYDPERQQQGQRPCETLNCADICVTSGAASAICLCSEGMKPSGDGRNCVVDQSTVTTTLAAEGISNKNIEPTSEESRENPDDKPGWHLYAGIGATAGILLIIMGITVCIVLARRKSKNSRRRDSHNVLVNVGAAGNNNADQSDRDTYRQSHIYSRIDESSMNQGQGHQSPEIPGMYGNHGYHNHGLRMSLHDNVSPPTQEKAGGDKDDYESPVEVRGIYHGYHDNPPSYESLPYTPASSVPNTYAGLNHI